MAILRLAGIYGPGRNALENVRQGMAKLITKPGQVFNRIHVTDIAQAIDAAFISRSNGVFNVADDEPAPPGDPIVFATTGGSLRSGAGQYEEFAASFYAEAKRVRNVKLKSVLGVKLRYPTYREGLSALNHDGG